MRQPIMSRKRAEEIRNKAVEDLEWAKRLNDVECIRIHRERIAKLDLIIDYYEPEADVCAEVSEG